MLTFTKETNKNFITKIKLISLAKIHVLNLSFIFIFYLLRLLDYDHAGTSVEEFSGKNIDLSTYIFQSLEHTLSLWVMNSHICVYIFVYIFMHISPSLSVTIGLSLSINLYI